jgi:hypothetical protein
MVRAHPQKAAIVLARLANEDRFHGSLPPSWLKEESRRL